jgi:mono/diheme cytochrome c family protein
MMIQATIPSALGLFFTHWHFDRSLQISGAVTMAAIAFLWLVFRRGTVKAWALLPVCAFYGIFVALIAHDFAQRWERIPVADHRRLNPLSGQPQAIAAGAEAYREHCMKCHRDNARGDGAIYPSLHSARIKNATDGDIEWFLRQGDMGRGMPSWNSLDETERWQIVSWLKNINNSPNAGGY